MNLNPLKFFGKNNGKWKGGLYKDVKKYHQKYQKRYKPVWVKNNKDKVSSHNKRRRARKRGAEGFHTLGEWELLKKQYGYKCPHCEEKEPKIKLTEDHIIPLIKGGSDYIENIQPLCKSCNCKKGIQIIKVELT